MLGSLLSFLASHFSTAFSVFRLITSIMFSPIISHTNSELVLFGIIINFLNVYKMSLITLSMFVLDVSVCIRANNALNNGNTMVLHMSFLPSPVAFDRYGYNLTKRKSDFFLIPSFWVFSVSLGSK